MHKLAQKKLSNLEKSLQQYARFLLPADLKRILRTLNLPLSLRPYSCALSSYPRSGNTWLRLILEDLGLRTGSIYKSDGVHSRSLRGDVIKTHSLDTMLYKKAILLVRNPFSAIASYWTYSSHSPEDLGLLPQFATDAFQKWFQHLECWHTFNGHLLIIQYESLCDDPLSAVRNILRFLDKPLSDVEINTAIRNTSHDRLRIKYSGIREISPASSTQYSVELIPVIKSLVTDMPLYGLFEASTLKDSVMCIES